MRRSAILTHETLCLLALICSTSGCGAATPADIQLPAVVSVSSVTIAPTTVNLDRSQASTSTAVLTTTIRDAGGNVLIGRYVDWRSSDLGVATVSSGGTVVASGKGTATITAMCEGQVGSATVTVDLSVVERLQFAPELGIKLSTFTKSPTGLYYRDSLVGSGTIAATGNLTETFFTAWLPDGKLLETDEVPPPFLSRLGSGFAIAGFDEGVTGMRVGGIRLVIIPPELGYGAKGAGSVPGDVVLVFRVRLTGVQ